MVSEETTRCEHLACLCDVPATETTCSASCASTSHDAESILCGCGHAACAEQIEAQLHGGAGKESLS